MEGTKLEFAHVLIPGNAAQQNQCHDFKTEGGKLNVLWLFRKRPTENDFVGL